MDVKPHWGTLCKESKAALYLMVMIIPLEVLVFSTATLSFFAQKKQQQAFVPERREALRCLRSYRFRCGDDVSAMKADE